MDENKAELKARLERALRRLIPRAAWDKYDRDEWIEDFYEKKLDHGGEEANFRALEDVFAKELEYLDRIEQEKAQATVEEHETRSVGDALLDQNLESESQHFKVELGDYEIERQLAFAEVMARVASEEKEVIEFRRDFLGGKLLTTEQAHNFLESPATRYFGLDFLKGWGIPLIEHKAAVVEYDEGWGKPEIDHRVSVSADPPGTVKRAQYAPHWVPAVGDETIRKICVYADLECTQAIHPNEHWLAYRDREGFNARVYPWPGSVLDELRWRCDGVARLYSWEEEDTVWFFLTGEPPRLNVLELKVRMTAGNLTTITMTVAPWVSLETVKRNYQKIQSQMLEKGNHALSLRSVAVLRFVEGYIRERRELPRWRELLDHWNREHPEWRYQEYRGLRQTYFRTLNAVADARVRLPNWKLSPAQEKRIRKTLERAGEVVELDHKRGDNKQTEI